MVSPQKLVFTLLKQLPGKALIPYMSKDHYHYILGNVSNIKVKLGTINKSSELCILSKINPKIKIYQCGKLLISMFHVVSLLIKTILC